ncbi:MAG TPA: cytochrome c oxidase subunit II [Xanthobacteraceae bacterium]
MLVFKRLAAVAVVIGALVTGALLAGGDVALAAFGQATPWQLGMQDSASPVMDRITEFHDILLYWISAISAFVLILLVIVMVRFNARANPTPSRVTHNTTLEVLWTVIPVVILTFIAIPSFKLLFLELTIPPSDVTVKAIGKQWYWTYSYPDNGKFEFDSLMLQDKDRKADQPRLLSVDNEMVVPVNKVVRMQIIGAEVIHSFTVPSFGVRIDAVPGRLNETWFKATREGMYYGQCSELCGRDHAFMPIAVRVVSEQAFKDWVTAANNRPEWKTAGADRAAPTAVAEANGSTAR